MPAGRPVKYHREKDFENYIFDNLNDFIGEYDKKKKQCPPVLPFLQDITRSYSIGGASQLHYNKFKRPDILATTKDGILKIVEIKLSKSGWSSYCYGIVQLMEYYRLAVVKGNWRPDKIEVYLIVDKNHESITDLLNFYQWPIKLIFATPKKGNKNV